MYKINFTATEPVWGEIETEDNLSFDECAKIVGMTYPEYDDIEILSVEEYA